MDTPDNVGEEFACGQLFRNIDLRGHSASYVCNWLSYTKPYAFYELVKAISRGNISVENQILRCWRIRRGDIQAALSFGHLRVSDVRQWADAEGCSDWPDDGSQMLQYLQNRPYDVEER